MVRVLLLTFAILALSGCTRENAAILLDAVGKQYSGGGVSTPPANTSMMAQDPAQNSSNRASNSSVVDVCNCKGYSGFGGPCYNGFGGPAYAGSGGPADAGYGGPCYRGKGGANDSTFGGKNYSGFGGPAYSGFGGPKYQGHGGAADATYGGRCYAGYGGPCYSGFGGKGDKCPSNC